MGHSTRLTCFAIGLRGQTYERFGGMIVSAVLGFARASRLTIPTPWNSRRRRRMQGSDEKTREQLESQSGYHH